MSEGHNGSRLCCVEHILNTLLRISRLLAAGFIYCIVEQNYVV